MTAKSSIRLIIRTVVGIRLSYRDKRIDFWIVIVINSVNSVTSSGKMHTKVPLNLYSYMVWLYVTDHQLQLLIDCDYYSNYCNASIFIRKFSISHCENSLKICI